jgi:hypothetical protein
VKGSRGVGLERVAQRLGTAREEEQERAGGGSGSVTAGGERGRR